MSESIGRAARSVAPVCLAAALVVGCGEGGAEPSVPSDPGVRAAAAGAVDADQLVASYDRALDYLLTQQKGGKWSVQGEPNVGYTAICAATFLERPGGMREADKGTIDASLAFVSAAVAEDGGVADAYRPNYETSVVVMALSAADDAAYRPIVDRSVGFLKHLQRLEDDNPTWGGIGYGSDDTRSDLSNTQYALASLRAAGIPEDDPVFQRAVKFLERTQNRKENETAGEPTEWTDPTTGKTLRRGNDGGANYFPGNSKAGVDETPDGVGILRSYGSMTYALLRCYALAGIDAGDGRVKAAIDWLSENYTLEKNPGMSGDDAYSGLYYMYATMAKALTAANVDTLDVPDRGAVDWRADLGAHLVSLQREDGSWVNDRGERWMEDNPVLVTCYALTALGPCARR